MADRYLRATGNWNGPVWAATSDGAAGSAATPTASDDVYISANFTVTLTANAECDNIQHSNGTLNINGQVLDAKGGLSSFGSSARSLILNGTLIAGEKWQNYIYLAGSNLTVDSSNSLIIVNAASMPGTGTAYGFSTLSKIFNDVVINLGDGTASSIRLNITGSPTFRSLIIQSKNSAAHTVNFDNGAVINVSKFVAIGSSSANKLTIKGNSDGVAGTQIVLSSGGSSFGQYVHADGVKGNTFSGVPKYLGSSSTQTTGIASMGWLLQDPPKISTLVDPLTTAPGSNPNWTVSGTVAQSDLGAGGGGYALGSSGGITTSGTYDLVGSSVVLEFPALHLDAEPGSTSFFGDLLNMTNYTIYLSIDKNYVYVMYDNYKDEDYRWGEASMPPKRFVKITVSSTGRIAVADSDNGATWGSESVVISSLDEHILHYLRSTRLSFYSNFPDPSYVVGSINTLPSPTSSGAFLAFFF